MKKHVFLLLALISFSTTQAQDFKTLTYFINDTIELQLDLFLPKTKSKEKLPLIIHVHGGGFAIGTREWGHHISEYAATKDYAAASISYSLYMKDKNFSCDGSLPEKIKAIQIAANQLQQAVIFFNKNKDVFNIDTTKIFLSGSSAGAEAVLHAAFWDDKMMKIYRDRLPDGFKYAGVISGAGAIMDLNLINKNNLVPVLLFHGSADTTVPYATAAHHSCPPNSSGWLMLFGSYSIYNHIIALNGSTKLITYCGGAHEYSDKVFSKTPQMVIDFTNSVLNKEKQQSHTIIATGKNKENNMYNFCD
ncbi:alpha/beta hydrolase [Flavobacterium cerinum]|uniref:Alpha/beta hydrolase n=1 Tax=Flavobacterium cerinum TaxID=2502784 RepID=A0A3S3RJ24_9FLAO|nr:alpha/beta hydrolase fold domain-containing protein [Flavobacterium cerinum]RWW99682.1 alpha/beta hydrolase [Flavobacterium cerinum]